METTALHLNAVMGKPWSFSAKDAAAPTNPFDLDFDIEVGPVLNFIVTAKPSVEFTIDTNPSIEFGVEIT